MKITQSMKEAIYQVLYEGRDNIFDRAAPTDAAVAKRKGAPVDKKKQLQNVRKIIGSGVTFFQGRSMGADQFFVTRSYEDKDMSVKLHKNILAAGFVLSSVKPSKPGQTRSSSWNAEHVYTAKNPSESKEQFGFSKLVLVVFLDKESDTNAYRLDTLKPVK